MSANPVVFDIEGISLGHGTDSPPVLHIPKLKISRGQLTFILGPSGAGKSTLLETLGAMKQCVRAGASGKMDLNSVRTGTISMLPIWENGGEAATTLRNEHYSFIFQSTDLMPNFTLGENICFTGMLGGQSMKEVEPRARELMEALNLESSLFNQAATSASGGQRQRVAFVRALCKEYEVLFGDEPTGNLDHGNAISLFETLQHQIKKENRSAVIVSHDLSLSERFADEILTIKSADSSDVSLGISTLTNA